MRTLARFFRGWFCRITGRPEQLELDLWRKPRR